MNSGEERDGHNHALLYFRRLGKSRRLHVMETKINVAKGSSPRSGRHMAHMGCGMTSFRSNEAKAIYLCLTGFHSL